MKFGPVRASEAEGAILAHGLRLPGGIAIRKGTVLAHGDISAIIAAGIDEVIVARAESDDIGENDAAYAIANALVGPGLRAEAAATGRVNLYATADGLFVADAEKVNSINRIDPGITLATLPNLLEVNSGRMVATVKIIPYAVDGAAVASAAAAAGNGVIAINAYSPRRIGVVATQLPSLKPSVMDKTIRVLKGRLAISGSSIVREIRTEHLQEAVAAGIRALIGESDIVLVFGASAICDVDDVIPTAIKAEGGKVLHFGMPVDPGNLMLLGEVDGKPVIGAPGCARSPAENGFDWILQRLIAGRKVTADEITGMGVGGLLMEIGSRPQPREGRRAAPRLSAVILAAGQSKRMGTANKMLAKLGNKPLVAHVAEAALAAHPAEVIVVTGHEADVVGAALGNKTLRLVHNADFTSGMASSLVAGIKAVDDASDGVIMLLGDMPLVSGAMIEKMANAFGASSPAPVVVAAHNGERGNPVIWPRRLLERLMKLTGDKGARDLLVELADETVMVELGEAASLDLDTPEALEKVGGTISA
ncbi:MAG: molybdopterin-binding/glycosyltransferase family 2 protein [Nitratireductor sp.]|nr:molybdopterin-binding/glycosyltransferase family 2 protein [Nitratireductor sp.]